MSSVGPGPGHLSSQIESQEGLKHHLLLPRASVAPALIPRISRRVETAQPLGGSRRAQAKSRISRRVETGTYSTPRRLERYRKRLESQEGLKQKSGQVDEGGGLLRRARISRRVETGLRHRHMGQVQLGDAELESQEG